MHPVAPKTTHASPPVPCPMSLFWKLSAAGFAATAITYGPARMGFGLFLPVFREEFSLTTQTAGLVSSLGFLGFFVGLLVSQTMTNRAGPRLPVGSGLLAATVGLGIVAAAPNTAGLIVGVSLAMTSAGLSWTPFNNAIHRCVDDDARPVALSCVSTGTSLGITAAGLAALLLALGGVSWRVCWAGFAAASAAALLVNWSALSSVASPAGRPPRGGLRSLGEAAAIPLFVIGVCYGVTSSVYISFATDWVAASGGLAGLSPNAAGGLVFLCYGAFGLIGLFTNRMKSVLGLAWLVRLLLLASGASLALVALLPASWAGVVASAGIQGMTVMTTSAVLAFWSERLFPSLPSQAFTAVLLAVAAGSVLGPVGAGALAHAAGTGAMFLVTAALSVATAVATRSSRIRERPAAILGADAAAI